MLVVRLETEIERRLVALAQQTGRTKTFYAREGDLQGIWRYRIGDYRILCWIHDMSMTRR
jgi:mRNA-degrading endonuclease RelE of RelBE toxin-antitoxin system